ncbi:hypothetical protein [Nocardia sp. NBC_00403]|uniref:hypothetical protein n=1 Tax=Nocardia sp. NBC_00403 TaxID=2975990 RepID=UPI002E22957A
MDAVDTAQRAAAQILNVDFFDTGAVTRGNGTCSADPLVNEFLSPHGECFGLTWHPTEYGDTVVSTALQQWIVNQP